MTRRWGGIFQFSNHLGVIAARPQSPLRITAVILTAALSAFMLTPPATAADSVLVDATWPAPTANTARQRCRIPDAGCGGDGKMVAAAG